jgi:hypothetical protein
MVIKGALLNTIRRNLVFILISIIFIGFRTFFNDPWNASIPTNDTESYTSMAYMPFFSSEFQTGSRPITMPLLFKAFAPTDGYDVSIRSEPSIGKIPELIVLPGFSGVAFVQSALSLFCWLILSFVLYKKIQNIWLRIVAAAFVLISACMPDIVSWDHVMMSESLTFSLFALILAISLLLFDKSFFEGIRFNLNKGLLAAGFLVSMFFWVNARDTNVYFLIVCIISLAIGLDRKSVV